MAKKASGSIDFPPSNGDKAEPRTPALRDHIESIASQTTPKMTAEEVRIFREGEARRKAQQNGTLAQEPKPQGFITDSESPASSSMPRESALRAHADAIAANANPRMTPDELRIFREGQDKRKPYGPRPASAQVTESRVSALRDHADSIAGVESDRMTFEELALFRKGEARRKETLGSTSLPADATHAETKTALAESVQKLTVHERLAKWAKTEGADKKFFEENVELHEKVERAKEFYLLELRKFQRNRSLGDAAMERLGFKKANESEGSSNLRELKNAWLEGRKQIAIARLDSVVQRRNERDATARAGRTRGELESVQEAHELERLRKWEAMTPAQQAEAHKRKAELTGDSNADATPGKRERGTDAVLARFQRRYILKDAVLGAAKEEAVARLDALKSRDKNLVEGIFKAYGDLPQNVKDIVTQVGLGAGVVGVAAGTAGLFAAGGVGAVAMAPILAGAAVGLRWRIQAFNKKKEADRLEVTEGISENVQRIRLAQQSLQKKARFTTFSGLTGLATEIVTRGLQAGTRSKAEADISLRDKKGNLGGSVGDLREADLFENLAQSVERAYASAKQADAQLVTATTVGTVAGGMALGGAYGAGVHSVNSLFQHDVPAVATHVTPPEHQPIAHPVQPGAQTEHPVTSSVSPSEFTSVTPVQSVSPEGLLVGSTIHRPGEGFGDMIQQFKHNFHEQLPGVTEQSPALAHVLNSDPNALAHELGTASDGHSLTMQPGDQFVADENQNIWFQPQGGEPQLVFENDPTAPGGFVHHDITGHMQVDGGVHQPVSETEPVATHHETPRVAESQTPVAHTETPDEVTARLNTEGRMGHPIAPSEAPVNTDAPVSQEDVASTGDTPVHHDVPEAAPAPAPEQAQPVTPPAAAPAEHSPVAPSTDTADAPATAEVPPGVGEAFVNPNNVSVVPTETHLYTVADASAPEGQQLVVFGGGDPTQAGFIERVQQLAREHPGRKVYFDAGYPVDYNGVMRRWINSVVFDPKGGITMGVTPEGPEMIGVINPNTFINRVN